jgi:hypothetical protein
MKILILSFVLAVPFFAGCGGAEPVGEEAEAVKACTLMPIYCPPECHQTGGGCPVQCHCPGYNACGPKLKCGEKEVCCSGPIVYSDPALNHYSCNPPGSLCPL